jgi:hypothetical protein
MQGEALPRGREAHAEPERSDGASLASVRRGASARERARTFLENYA